MLTKKILFTVVSHVFLQIRALLEERRRDAKVVAEVIGLYNAYNVYFCHLMVAPSVQAVWESGLESRDAIAQRKREDKSRKQEAMAEVSVIRTVRAEKLAELYRRDEEIYEDELNAMGLAFTRSEF